MKKTWEQKARRAQMRREYERNERNKRALLHPLRLAVNKALKASGMRHSVTTYSSRVRGWPTSTSRGWETESVYWSDPKHIRVSINLGGNNFSKHDPKEHEELMSVAENALKGFLYKIDGYGFEVYAEKDAS